MPAAGMIEPSWPPWLKCIGQTCITCPEGSHQRAIILLKLWPKPTGRDNSSSLLRNCESRYRRQVKMSTRVRWNMLDLGQFTLITAMLVSLSIQVDIY